MISLPSWPLVCQGVSKSPAGWRHRAQGAVHTPSHPTYRSRSPGARFVPLPIPKRRTPTGLAFVGLPVPAPRARPNNGLGSQFRIGTVPQPTPSVCTGYGGEAAWDLQNSHFCPLRTAQDYTVRPGSRESRERLARRSYPEGPQVGSDGAFWP